MGGLIDVLLFRRRRGPRLEPGPARSPRPELWFCPSPGTPDWHALSDPDVFAMLAKDCDALQFYQGHLTEQPLPPWRAERAALPPHGWNTWRAFREWGILPMATAHGLRVAVECAGLKEWSDDPAAYAGPILESIRLTRAIGGRVDAVALDEPWNAGLQLRQPPWSVDEVRHHLDVVRGELQRTEPDVAMGLIEPYPAIDADTLCSIIHSFAPAFFHLDIDYRAAMQRGTVATLQAAIVRLSDCCRAAGVPFGIIIWGYEEETAESFVRSAHRLLATVQEAVTRGDLPWPDRLIVQSWSATAVLGPRLIPPTLPPEDPDTLWGLLRTVRRSL